MHTTRCRLAGRRERLALLCLLASSLLVLTLGPVSDSCASAGRGLYVYELDVTADAAGKAEAAVEAATHLKAGWVRLAVSWSSLESARGQYSETYLASLDQSVEALRSRNIRIVMTFYYVPKWASDPAFWSSPPTGLPAGYSPRYPVRDDALADLGSTAEYLAARYRGLVKAYECWNEPNLWPYLYPQRTSRDEHFGSRTYLKYLKVFGAGIKRGDPAARVVAGATAPVGLDDAIRTSPQKFARFLAANGAAAHFDIYSHHPYTPGGSVYAAPDKPPNNPNTTVTLYNLNTLLKLFPGKPFWLTEYGYNTQPSLDFGGFVVREAAQARYLRRAYQYADRYKQVKVLFWFLVRDLEPASGDPRSGAYTGLRRPDGSRKPSWYAYAGGNRVSLLAPTRLARGRTVTLTSRVTNAAIGPVRDQQVLVQGRRAGTRRWYTLATRTPGSDGRFTYRLKLTRATQFRVLWNGVSTSPVRTVRMR
jgi:hypothetical protein